MRPFETLFILRVIYIKNLLGVLYYSIQCANSFVASAGGGTAAESAPDCTMLMDCAHGGCANQLSCGPLTLTAAIAASVTD